MTSTPSAAAFASPFKSALKLVSRILPLRLHQLDQSSARHAWTRSNYRNFTHDSSRPRGSSLPAHGLHGLSRVPGSLSPDSYQMRAERYHNALSTISWQRRRLRALTSSQLFYPVAMMLIAAPAALVALSLWLRLATGTPVLVPFSNSQHPDHNRSITHGAVACESEICSAIGLDFLRKGGNAADALIGIAFCLNVVACYHVGMGGGGYMLVRNSTGQYESILFKEVAPTGAYETMFANNVNASIIGGTAVAVPGELRGLEHLHRGYASFSWSDLIKPAIRLARDGFEVNKDMVVQFDGNDFLRTDPSWAIDFAPNGTVKGLGDILTRKRFAHTLEQISKGGADVFYNGDMAEATIRAIQAGNGTMTTDDLRNFQIRITDPLQITYRDFIITGNDAPSGGPQSLSIMKTVEGYDSMGWPEMSNLSTHYMDEAFRFSWGERPHLGDPLFNDTVESFVHWTISEGAAEQRRSKISDSHTLDVSAYDPQNYGNVNIHGTSAVTVTDMNGMTIAWTSTVNYPWGSQVCVPETGIVLNDAMNDFSNPSSPDLYGIVPSPINYPQPGKRPMGTVSNLIVEHANNRTFYFASGTAGGSHIPTTGTQMLWHVLDRNRTATEAIDEPRFHDQLHPNEMDVDWTFDNTTVAFLRSLGHNVSLVPPGYSHTQAVLGKWDGTFEAATDPQDFNYGAGVI